MDGLDVANQIIRELKGDVGHVPSSILPNIADF